MTIPTIDAQAVAAANATGRTPVLFVHGLWLHPSSWQQWIDRFDQEGYAGLATGWPGDLDTVAATRADPSGLGGVGIEEITARYREVIAGLDRTPVVVGHSFGGLVAQKLLGEGLARAAVAISPAQMRGVFRLPAVQLRNALPVLGRPSQWRGVNARSQDQFAQAFGNALPREESDRLHDAWTIPAPGRPIFEAGLANLVAGSPAAVATRAERGPLLLIGAGRDRTVPAATVRAEAKLYRKAPSVTEYKEYPDRGHSLILDSGWTEIADYVLSWLAFVGQEAKS